jgi:hypothetical protein
MSFTVNNRPQPAPKRARVPSILTALASVTLAAIILCATSTAPLSLQCLDQHDDGTSLCHVMRTIR